MKATDRSGGVVLVAAASGLTGREIVHQSRDQGFTVRAMARSAQRLSGLGPGVQPVFGDVTDPASLVQSLSQVNVVISAIGGRWPIGENGFEAIDYRGNEARVDAAKRAHVGRFLLVSAGSGGRRGILVARRPDYTAVSDPALAPDAWRARRAALPRD